ncbi:hypothetical protein HNQ69_001064 [Bartonella callosciuri]|uniref:Uncharacterized protein n=1 Tax=Bartonella callosciuri TaxID=686223 RepID=A0A840NS90_9HYPH|nr:hypothetical protein [Bartonella callosciuri]MBB5073931.1 hypothetical protein [Bartonella callosciuri]
MFKIFKNRVFLFVFKLFIIFFLQTVESQSSVVNVQFQEKGIVETFEKNTIMAPTDMAVIRDTDVQDGFAFGKTEQISLFSAFWSGFGIVALLASLSTGNIPGAVLSIIALLF